jgi:hypothetical protein
MVEEWRDIPGYEGEYEASSFGHIRSARYHRVLKEQLVGGPKGYLYVGLKLSFENTKVKQVHRLVAAAFFVCSNLEVDHIDCNHKNNRVDNLEYVTGRENYLRAVRTGVCSRPKAILRNDGKSYESIRQCARDNRCQPVDIRKVLAGKQKTLHGYTFDRCGCFVA